MKFRLRCFSIFALFASLGAVAPAAQHVRIGTLPNGPLNLITDVPGVAVGQVTKIEGSPGPLRPGIGPVRTGVTAILPNGDIWNRRVSAATFVLNGNGEMTGANWIAEDGFLSSPIALTNTLDVGRVDDGVIEWMLAKYPDIGVRDDVPLPVVGECDDQGLNDIRGRHVSAADTVAALDAAKSGAFERGNVGAGTGMHAFGFKGGIGSASRLAANYVVGVLVNVNTGSRAELLINGYPVGRALLDEYKPVYPRSAALATRGRAVDGSIIIVVATNAPLDNRGLTQIAKRAALGLARTGATSHLSSGDLILAFSTTRLYPNDESALLAGSTVYREQDSDALFAATAEATEAAIDDALFSARTMSGANNITLYNLPEDRVRTILKNR